MIGPSFTVFSGQILPVQSPPKMSAFAFEWSWTAFVGPKDIDDPNSPYYVPPGARGSSLEPDVSTLPVQHPAENLLPPEHSAYTSSVRRKKSSQGAFLLKILVIIIVFNNDYRLS